MASPLKGLLFWTMSVLLLSYPAGVYFGVRYLEPRYIGLIVFVLVGGRFLLASRQRRRGAYASLLPSTVMVGLLSLLLLIFNQMSLVYLKPVLLNGAMLVTFGYSLVRPPTIIERFARSAQPNLSPAAVLYTRRVTQVWCVFFVCNGLASAYTTMYASMKTWALYNGFVAYLIIGALVAGEYIVRIHKRRLDQL